MASPILHITCRHPFSAAHRLHTPRLSKEENLATFGPCFRQHGHNYVLFVTVKGSPDATNGMVMNFKDLDEIIDEEILSKVDHFDLCELDFLQGMVTTAENLAVAFWKRLRPRVEAFAGCSLHSVRLDETEDCFAEYFGEGL